MRQDALRHYDPYNPPNKDSARRWLLYALGDITRQLDKQREDSYDWDDFDQGVAAGLVYAEEALTDAIKVYDQPEGPMIYGKPPAYMED